jgi:hypothetical protein
MKIVLERAVLGEVFVSETSGGQFATLTAASGTFKLSAPKGGFDFTKLPQIEPMKIQADLRGRIYQNAQSLEVVDMSVDLIYKPKAA